MDQEFLSVVLALHDPTARTAFVTLHASTPGLAGSDIREQVIANTLRRMGKLQCVVAEAPLEDEQLWNRVRLGKGEYGGVSRAFAHVGTKTLLPLRCSRRYFVPEITMKRNAVSEFLFTAFREHPHPSLPVPRDAFEQAVTAFYENHKLHTAGDSESQRHNRAVDGHLAALLRSIGSDVHELFLLPRFVQESLEEKGYEIPQADHGIEGE